MANTTEAKQITVCLKKRHIGYKDTIIGQNCNFGSKLIVFLQAMKSLGGALYAILSSAAFGLVPLFSIPLLAAGLSSPQILFFRMVFAAAIIGMASKLIFGKSLGLPFGTLCRVAVLSTLYAATSLGLVESYKYIPSGVATTIHFLYPLVVTIIMALLFKVKTPKLILLAVVLSLAGVALLSCGDMGDANPRKGIALAGMTALTYASYITGVMKSRGTDILRSAVFRRDIFHLCGRFGRDRRAAFGRRVVQHNASGADTDCHIQSYAGTGHQTHRIGHDVDTRLDGATHGRHGRGFALR